MSAIDRQGEIACLLGHYFKQFCEASGKRWTPQNEADMDTLAALICGDTREPLPSAQSQTGARSKRLPSSEEEEPEDAKTWMNEKAAALGFVPNPKRRR